MSDFINDFISNIEKGVQAVSSRGKEFIEISKLKLEISNIRSSLKLKFNALGQKTYEMFVKNELDLELLKADCEEIKNSVEKIANIEATIKDMETAGEKPPAGEEVIACPKCGALNKTGEKICGKCGAEIPEAASGVKSCPSCGMPATAESNFCSKCGSKLS